MDQIPNIIIIGGGGHSKVVVDIINTQRRIKCKILGYYDDDKNSNLYDIKYLGKINKIQNCESDIYYTIAIGDCNIRKNMYNKYNNLRYISLIHPKSIISRSAIIEEGTVICAGAIVQPEVKIGKCCIINTNSNIDHESIICDFVNINPSATLCGNVLIGKNTIVGANATIIEKIKIGECNIIGAGSVIIRDTTDHSKLVGVPGKLLNY
jgi:acetyltransferase EpsM